MVDHRLSDKQLDIIRNTLAPYAQNIEKVCLFGSRATGMSKPNSDIDIVLYGDIDESLVDRLWTLFHESNLAITVDINAYHLIAYPPLKQHIDDSAKTLFTREDLLS